MKILRGNLFTSTCQTLVNTINCAGVMGAGIAYEFRLRYPGMYSEYLGLCARNKIETGKLWLYKSPARWILNFPTKTHWKYPSRPEYLEKGLDWFMANYKKLEIQSIAFPLLGAQNGGLEPPVSLGIMEKQLADCDIPVEIYEYDPLATDDLFETFCQRLLALTAGEISDASGIREGIILNIRQALLEQPGLCTMSSLLRVKGVGDKSLEKLFQFIRTHSSDKPNQELKLF